MHKNSYGKPFAARTMAGTEIPTLSGYFSFGNNPTIISGTHSLENINIQNECRSLYVAYILLAFLQHRLHNNQ